MNRTTPPAEYNSRSDSDEGNKCHHTERGGRRLPPPAPCYPRAPAQPPSELARETWPGSVLGRPDESMVDAVRADVIPDNDAVVVNRTHFRCQGAGRVDRSEDALVVDESVRVAQSIVIPSRHLAAVVDGERNRVDGARRLDMAEDAINAHHGVGETSRLIAGKPAHVSLLIDPVQPGSERAGKADVSEHAILPDKSVRRGGSFRRD